MHQEASAQGRVSTTAVSPQSPDLLPSLHGEAFRRRDFRLRWGPLDPRLSGCPDHLPPTKAYSAIRGAADPGLRAGRGKGTPASGKGVPEV